MTLVVGDNGEGKTNLLEAIGYLATVSSFRGAPPAALVRQDVGGGRLVQCGTHLADARVELVARLVPVLAKAYDQLAHAPADVEAMYIAPWREHGLLGALAAARRDELRRGVSLIGPHRDELA